MSHPEPAKCDTTMTIRMPAALRDQIIHRARVKRRKPSEWVRMAIEETLALVKS